jgi:spermidine/putrescine transport system substrate-binding protein
MRSVSLSSFLLAGALTASQACAADDLLVLDWGGFDIEGLATDYVAKRGTPPTYTFFGDDDEAFQKLSSGFRSDVTHPCSQVVSKYRDAGLIEPWDTSRIPEFANIDPAFLNSPIFKDDAGVWFMPADWASTAIGYNSDEVPAGDVDAFDVFLDPKYAGRISLPDNTDDVWSLALLATGVTDWDGMTDAEFDAATEWLRQAHANVRAYWVDPGELAQLMASGEVLVAWTWPDAVTLLKADNFPVAYTREAKEGSVAWFCGYVNMKDGPGSEDAAYDFINSWLRPEAGQPLFDAVGYGHASLKAQELVGAEAMNAAGLGQPKAPVFFQTPMDAALRDRLVEEFEKIKSGF